MLSFNQKFELIRKIEKGESEHAVAENYGISRSFVRKIYVHRKEIKKYFYVRQNIRKRLPKLGIFDLEAALYQWYIRCLGKNIKLSLLDIKEKAEELNQYLNIDPNFKVNTSWLEKFQRGISCANKMRYFLTPTDNTSNFFKAYFQLLLRNNEIAFHNVYNANYSVIVWKAVPRGTLIFDYARRTKDPDMHGDYVTVLLCVNATQSHKLPVLVIGNIEEQQSSSILNTGSTSTIYKANIGAWMDNTIFNQWFEEYFLKSVKEIQEKNGRRERTLLLLDNTKMLLNLDELNRKDEFVRVISIPFDVSPEIQPINNEVINYFRRMYRKEFVVTLMLSPLQNTEETIINTYKRLTLGDGCHMIQNAWSCVDDAILKRGWMIFFGYGNYFDKLPDTIMKDIKETTAYLRTLAGCKKCCENNVFVWFMIENVRDMIMKICTDEVLQDFGNIDVVNNTVRLPYWKIRKSQLTWLEAQDIIRTNFLY